MRCPFCGSGSGSEFLNPPHEEVGEWACLNEYCPWHSNIGPEEIGGNQHISYALETLEKLNAPLSFIWQITFDTSYSGAIVCPNKSEIDFFSLEDLYGKMIAIRDAQEG